MLINDINAEIYGVVSTSFEFGMAEVVTYEDWLRGATAPVVYEQNKQYGTCKLETMITAKTRNELENNISNLTAALTNCEIMFDSVNGVFSGFLTDRSIERLSATLSKVTFNLQGGRMSNHFNFIWGVWNVSAAGVNKTIAVQGNCDVPLTVTFTPNAAGNMLMYINGVAYGFTALAANTQYTLDAVKGRFYKTVNGSEVNAIDQYDEYTLPVFKAGDNIVSFKSSTITQLKDVSLRTQGRWQ